MSINKSALTTIIATALTAALSSQVSFTMAAEPTLPDFAVQNGLTIGGVGPGNMTFPNESGKFLPWGGKLVAWNGNIELNDTESAPSTAPGQCRFPIYYELENIGGGAAGFQVEVAVGSTSANVWQYAPLTVYADTRSKTKVWAYVYVPAGASKLQLKIDAKSKFAESNEANNIREINLKVSGTCGAKPALPPAPKPDLVSQRGIAIGGAVSGAGSKTSVWGGTVYLKTADTFLQSNGKCAVNIIYDMANAGAGNAGPSFTNRLYNGALLVSQQSGLSLNAGKTRLIATQAYLTPGLNLINLKLDAEEKIAETNEANNSTKVTVMLDSTCSARK